MAEGKYGRLFTEADVSRIVHAALVADAADRSLSIACLCAAGIAFLDEVPGRATFPADEPLFLLRGQDLEASEGVNGYLQAILRCEGVSLGHIHAVCGRLLGLLRWQREHPDRVKVPD